LRPRKAKELIPEVAKELGIPQDIVEDVIDYYWQEIRKNLSSLKHTRVHLTNLGDFTIKHWKIDDKIEMFERWEENNRQKGLQQITARFKVAESLFELKDVKKIVEEEQQRKDFIKLHKTKSNVSKKEHYTDLEDQGSDS
jgi:hypothetical protein